VHDISADMRTFRNLFSKKEAGELESKQTDQLGSLILFDSTTDDGGVDIVFVHGLRGTSLGTWSKDGVCWPRDLLNEDINNASLKARAITWGYDASIANVLTYASKESIFGHAETLLGDLSRLRVDNVWSPLPSTRVILPINLCSPGRLSFLGTALVGWSLKRR
jgi:hypothetical protein